MIAGYAAALRRADEARQARGEKTPEPTGLPPASPGQFIGIWERKDGTAWEVPNRHPTGRPRAEVERETLGDRAFWAMREEHPDEPGRAKDTIIQRWIEGHGPMAYIMSWREKIDRRL